MFDPTANITISNQKFSSKHGCHDSKLSRVNVGPAPRDLDYFTSKKNPNSNQIIYNLYM